MKIGSLSQAFFLFALVLALSWQGAVAAQEAPRVEVGVRPSNVRAGGTFRVTVRVASGSWPEAIDLDAGGEAEVIDYEDRTSTSVGTGSQREHVLERVFALRALQPGVLDRITVSVAFPEAVFEHTVPAVTVTAAPLSWGRVDPSGRVSPRAADGADRSGARGRDVPDGGRAPGAEPVPGYDTRSRDPYGRPSGPYGPSPYGASPYGAPSYGAPPYGGLSPYGSSPYGFSPDPNRYYGSGGNSFGWGQYNRPFDGLPYGEGWAENAVSDPDWPELLPRWYEYQSRVSGDENVALLEVGLTPGQVYVGQQVTLLASASFAPGVGYGPGSRFEFHAAEPSNGWIIEIPPVFTPPVFGMQSALGGEALVFLDAVFPTSPGFLIINPAFLVYSSDGGLRGGPVQDTLIADYLEVQVLSIPQHEAPPGWRGAVGRYQVSAWLARGQVAWGETDLLTVEISGMGYVPALIRPDPGPVWGGGIRPLGERSWVQVRDGVVGGSKRFTWIVAPGEPGAVRIGPVYFSFFDPYIGGFGQVASEELVLDVGSYPGQDIRD